jgi:hypothetical protein
VKRRPAWFKALTRGMKEWANEIDKKLEEIGSPSIELDQIM